ncbi:MAG: hypothetical protein AB1586_21325 [Pseudomonadota bacterium]
MMIRSDIFTPAFFTTGKFTAAWFAIAFLTGLGVMVGMTTDPSQSTPRPSSKPDQIALVLRANDSPAAAADRGTLTKADRLDITAHTAADAQPAAAPAAPPPAVAAAAVIAPAPIQPARASQPAVAARWDNANASAVETKPVVAAARKPPTIAAHPPAPPKPAPVAAHPSVPARPTMVAARQEIRPPAEVHHAPPPPHRVAAKPAAPRNVASARSCQPSDNPFTGLLQSLNLMQRCEG